MNVQYQYFITDFLPAKNVKSLIFYSKVLAYSNACHIFVNNKTRHASHLNSAPGRVFDFYGGYIS
jgi:hypothetical protein